MIVLELVIVKDCIMVIYDPIRFVSYYYIRMSYDCIRIIYDCISLIKQSYDNIRLNCDCATLIYDLPKLRYDWIKQKCIELETKKTQLIIFNYSKLAMIKYIIQLGSTCLYW